MTRLISNQSFDQHMTTKYPKRLVRILAKKQSKLTSYLSHEVFPQIKYTLFIRLFEVIFTPFGILK